jgi:hypothetical protein
VPSPAAAFGFGPGLIDEHQPGRVDPIPILGHCTRRQETSGRSCLAAISAFFVTALLRSRRQGGISFGRIRHFRVFERPVAENVSTSDLCGRRRHRRTAAQLCAVLELFEDLLDRVQVDGNILLPPGALSAVQNDRELAGLNADRLIER